MNAYMTHGSLDLLKKYEEKNPNLKLYFMEDNSTVLAYYENSGETIFETARKYEVVISKGDLQKNGFVVMNNIPVTDEGRPIFESQFKQSAGMIEATTGFYGLRVLRPQRGNTYVVMVQWDHKQSYQSWKNSEAFAMAHSKTGKSNEKPPYAAGSSYVTAYSVVEEGS